MFEFICSLIWCCFKCFKLLPPVIKVFLCWSREECYFWPIATITLDLERITWKKLCKLFRWHFLLKLWKLTYASKYVWRYRLTSPFFLVKRWIETSLSPSSETHLANRAEYHSRKACRDWINYYNICSKAGANLLHTSFGFITPCLMGCCNRVYPCLGKFLCPFNECL